MESSEGGDDQGSGWLQVKKKHRSSSKFSLHGWVGGLSGKQISRNPRSQPLPSSKCEKEKRSDQLLKASLDTVVHDQGSATLVLNEDEKNVHSNDISVVTLDNKCPKSPLSAAINVEASNHKPRAGQEHTTSSAVHFKIKWGDLDDEILNAHHESSIGADRNTVQIEDHQLIFEEAKNVGDSLSHMSATVSKENKLIATITDEDHVRLESHALCSMEEFVEENCKEVNEVFPEDVKTQIINESVGNRDDAMASFQGQCEFTKTDNDGNCSLSSEIIPSAEFEESTVKPDNDNNCIISSEKIICTANEEDRMTQIPIVVYESSCSRVSGAPFSAGESSKVVLPEEPVLRPIDNSGPCSPGASEGKDTVEVFKVQQDEILDNLSNSHIEDSADADETGGSKERFRERLWCFLFENLNRALDELYLLCELECDLEQVTEAVLVLEEATSDFRELNSRVKEFEKVKKSSSHLPGGAALTMKSDHRRPHALSWEVRRMTTSPRRAEILSSSLEAFRKIQQERSRLRANDTELWGSNYHNHHWRDKGSLEVYNQRTEATNYVKESSEKPKKQSQVLDSTHGKLSKEKRTTDSGKCASNLSRLPGKECSSAFLTGKSKKEPPGASSGSEKLLSQRDKMVMANVSGNKSKTIDHLKRQTPSEREKEKRNGNLWKSMDAWKEKRNWEDVLASPHTASRFSHSPGISRRSAERARILHDKLMSSDKKKKSALDLKREAEEKHARAMRIRSELENERLQKLQRASEKLNRVNEWQAVRSMKMREVIYDRHRRSESRHEAYLAQVVRRAGDESSKVNEVRFITSLNEENKKLMLRQKLHDSELRRAEKLQMLKTKQKEDIAREEAVLERKRLIEAEKLQRLAETQRKKEEAQLRREEERRASSAAREAKAIEQMRRKEVRAKAQQEEAELLAQKLAERLRESEQRRKFYLEQIRERASMDFRDQSSPLVRRSVNKDGTGRLTPSSNFEDFQANNSPCSGGTTIPTSIVELEHTLKRRIKRIRQRLMALKYEFIEPSVGTENTGIGYRTAVATARAKIGKWLQELQKLRQARKEGAANFGLIAAEMIKFLDGRDAELQASRQAGLLDFIASALPASHTSKPEACQITIYLLRLLRVVLSLPENRGYFLAQNLLPPIIPMLVAAIENYIKIVASLNVPSSMILNSSRSSTDTLDTISEILDGFLWTVAAVIGHESSDERQFKMQDGLLELVVAYKVIHRLRDLFALYDRPQVEGSPFPPSILLSIKLLAVLTRSRNMSCIDWESFTSKTMGSENEIKVAESVNIRCSSACTYPGDNGTLSPKPSGNLPLPLPDVPEERPLDEYSTAKKVEDASSHAKNPNEVEATKTEVKIAGVPDESLSTLLNDGKRSVSLKDEKNSVDKDTEERTGIKQPLAFLLSSIAETGLVCLPSMLTAVLLQANNRLSSEQTSYVLPSNFEEVATGVLKVLNNLAQIDMSFIQKILARPDLKIEFFHVMSFILSYCTGKWGAATDQNGLLLLESLSLLGYFALFHPENQAVLRWGKDRTILHKVCDLPFAFFSDPELMPVLAGTLVAACFGCEQNKGVIQQELSMDMLLSLLKSCRNSLPVVTSVLASDNHVANESGEPNQVDNSQRSHRSSLRSTRIQFQKSGALANNRTVRMRNQRENKMLKHSEETSLKQNQSAPQTFSALTLYSRFPESFIHKAEQFFSAEVPQVY